MAGIFLEARCVPNTSTNINLINKSANAITNAASVIRSNSHSNPASGCQKPRRDVRKTAPSTCVYAEIATLSPRPMTPIRGNSSKAKTTCTITPPMVSSIGVSVSLRAKKFG